jgi:hypothetical protein
MNAKAVQVIVVPAHKQLDDPVQVRDRQAVRKLDPPPNGEMNVPQQKLQPQQQRWALFDHRPTLDRHDEPCPRFVMGSILLAELTKVMTAGGTISGTVTIV